MKKSILIPALLFLSLQIGISQIQSVDYSLRYNKETCLFDCYLIVNQGKTKNTLSRAQFNSQVSIVAPVTSNVFVVESFMPLKDNQEFRSSDPVSWEITNELESPAELQDSRLVSISPVLAPTAFYNDLEQGDQVKLFSLKVSPLTDCGAGIRLFDNSTDPKSDSEGMKGADFDNGFTVGSVEQKYAGNSGSTTPTWPIFESTVSSNKYGINFMAKNEMGSNCQSSLNYEFFGPNGRIGTLDDYYAFAMSNEEEGEYRVIATDELGCSTEHKFYPFGGEEGETSITSTEETIEIAEAFSSSIFPNPTQDVVNLTMTGKPGTKVKADIFDLEGKKIKSSVADLQLVAGQQTIKISTGLTPGIYNLSLTLNNDHVVNHKVFIVK